MSVPRRRKDRELLDLMAGPPATIPTATEDISNPAERLARAPTRDGIARRAYQRFEERGGEPGREVGSLVPRGTRAVKIAPMAGREDLRDGGDTPPLDSLVARVRGEYCEMPGLRLTFAQACRLWQVDVSTCEMLLERLVREGFLYKTANGAYIAVPTTRRRI